MTRRPFFAIFCQVGAVVGVAVSVRAQPAAPVALAQVEAAQLDAVAVTPFANVSQDAADAWMGYGIAESVAVDLAARGGFEVVSGDRVQDVLKAGYDGLVRDEFQALAIGRELDTQWVITGGYQRLGGQLRITARLLETRTGEAVRAVKIDGPFEEIFELQDRIARELVDAEKVPRPARAMRSHAGAWPPIPSGEGGFGSFERGGAGANGPDVETSPGATIPFCGWAVPRGDRFTCVAADGRERSWGRHRVAVRSDAGVTCGGGRSDRVAAGASQRVGCANRSDAEH